MAAEKVEPPGDLLWRFLKSAWAWIYVTFRHGLRPLYVEFFKRPITFELPKRSGEVAVITGGARGIGMEVVRKLLECDFTVVLGVRNPKAGNDVISKIRKSGVSSGKALVLPLDLTSLKSVRNFASDVLDRTDRVDLLINNAGIMFAPFEETEDGYESHFQVNYLSHFLLTNCLLPRIKETASKKNIACRIINVSSGFHYGGILDFTDLEKCKVYSDLKAYQDSKLAQVLHTKYLDTVLQKKDANIRVYALHPGIIQSGLWIYLGNFINNIGSEVSKSGLLRTPEDGAQTVIYTALSPELETKGGVYINSCEIAKPHPAAEDRALQKLLWERSLQLSDNYNDLY